MAINTNLTNKVKGNKHTAEEYNRLLLTVDTNAIELTASTAGLTTKVDKIIGKSLISDSEIVRLSGVTNQDLTNYLTTVSWNDLTSTIPLSKIPVLTLDKLPDANLDNSEFTEDGTIKINKTFLDAYIDNRIALAGGNPGNTTPVAPTVTANDTNNTLDFSSTLGNSEIVISINGGAYVAYTGQINVGDVERPAGYWKAKIKVDTGRNESSITNSPAFTATPVEEGQMVYVTTPVVAENLEYDDTTHKLTILTDGDTSRARFAQKVASGTNSVITALAKDGLQLCLHPANGFGNQPAIQIGKNSFGQVNFYYNNGSEDIYGRFDGFYSQDVVVRLSVTSTLITFDFSLDNGVTFIAPSPTDTPSTTRASQTTYYLQAYQYTGVAGYSLSDIKGTNLSV